MKSAHKANNSTIPMSLVNETTIGGCPSYQLAQITLILNRYSMCTVSISLFTLFLGLGMSMSTTGSHGIVRHYFDKRKGGAFAGIALGAGIAQVAFPSILSAMFAKFGYKYTILYISPMFLLNIFPPVIFIDRLPLDKPKSAKELFQSYSAAFRRYVTPFFLLNALFARGAQLSILVLLFSHISNTTSNQVAVVSYIVIGFSFLASTVVLTLTMCKFSLNCYITQVVFNLLIGLTGFLMAALHIPAVYYICCGVFGFSHGGTLAVKGGLSIHVYPLDAVEYSYGLSEAVAGIGSFLFPVAAGYIQKYYGSDVGLYFLSAIVTVGGLMLVVAALFRTKLWTMRVGHRHIVVTQSDWIPKKPADNCPIQDSAPNDGNKIDEVSLEDDSEQNGVSTAAVCSDNTASLEHI